VQPPSPRAPRRCLGLRQHLLLLVLAVLLPVLAAGGSAVWVSVQAYRQDFEARLQDHARTLALAVDAEIGTVLAALQTLATAPALDGAQPDLPHFDIRARRVAEALGAGLLLIEPVTGQHLVDTMQPYGALLPASADLPELRRVAESGQPRVSNLVPGTAAAGRLVFTVSVPVLREGRVVSLLSAVVEPARLSRLLGAQGLAGGAFSSITDGARRILARSEDAEAMLGRPVPGWLHDSYRAATSGVAPGPDVRGRAALFGFAWLRNAPDWLVTVAQPWSSYRASWWRPAAWLAMGGALALALGATLAAWQARRLLRPVRALARRAESVAAGGSAPDVPPAGVVEFESLRTGLGAAEAVLRRQAADSARHADALARQNARLQELTATLDLSAVLVRDLEGHIGFWSEGMERLYHLPRAEACGAMAQELLRTCFPEPPEAIRAALLRDGTWQGELRHRRRDGREVVALCRWVLRRDGTAADMPVAVVEAHTDVTGLHAIEAALRESEARLRSVVDTAVDGILVAAEDGRIVSANPAAIRIFGYDTEAEMVGQDLGILMPAPEAVRHPGYLGAHRTTGRSRALGMPGRELTGRRRDGREFPIDVSVGSFHSGATRYFTGVVRDATARKATEEARTLLVREVDHRAKNALAVALSLVRLAPRDDAAAFAAGVEGRIAAMARAHSLLARERWAGADLRAVAEGELAAYPGRVALAGPAVRLAADAVQPVAMLLHELTTNAVKYGALSAPEGQVELAWDFADEADPAGLRLRWVERGGPAVSGPPSRLGFGSRLLDSLAERQLGGSLGLDWRAEGLHATLRLPPRQAAPADPAAPRRGGVVLPLPPPAPRETPTRPPRVLLVEDEALLSMEIEAALRSLGCEVVGPARRLADALRLVAAEPELQAAVLDVNLAGERIFPVVDLLVERGVPVLFSTGYGSADSLEGREAAAVAVLRKPYPREVLAAALRSALQRHEAARAG
jgi:PAS domain S-box-containing protein